jgi:pimeloyl-ACP methyl ester carboxylesterase
MSTTTHEMPANGLTFVVDEAGEGDAVALLLHGFPESRYSWRDQLPLLAGLGWRAIAPDQRGYGHSSRPPKVSDYLIDKLIDDVAGLFEAAGAKKRLLIGHDWGGAIAWAFAVSNRLPLDGLIVMNCPHPSVFARMLNATWAQKLKSWYMAFFQIPWLPEALMTAGHARAIGQAFTGFPDAVRDVYRDNAAIPGAMTAMVNYYRANVASMTAAFNGEVPPIETPTLLIWGEADAYLGVEGTVGYGPLVRDFTLKRLPGVSHWVQQEAAEAVNGIVAGWLAEKGIRPARR